jgi:4-amino-4-deoxy-L-arabinose transferase-like glycosyltransferase
MTKKSFSSALSPDGRQICFLLAFCILFFFVNLNQWDLWNPDEPRYGQVAREIVQGGDWILMHNNGKMYTDKPPFFFWAIAFSSFLWQGFTSFSVRFPSALFGTLTVLLVYFLGRSLHHSRSGFFSGLILATSFEFAYLATRANIDATLTFFTTASLFCFFRWRQGFVSPSPHLPISRTLCIYGFYVSMALATVTKGPVGFILPLLVSLTYLLVQRDWKGIREMRLLTGMVLFMAIVFAWYLPAIWKGGQVYLNETLFKHTLDRYSKGWSHVKPIYYYFINFPAEFLPWVLFLPGAIVYGFSKEEAEKRKGFLFLFIWFAAIFLFFTLSKGKRGLYLLPLYPATSLMIGRLLEGFSSNTLGSFNRKWMTLPLYGLMILMVIAGIVLPWGVSIRFPDFLFPSLPIALLLAGGSIVLFFLTRLKRYPAALFLLVGIVAGGFFYGLRVVFPLVNPYKSARFICQEITSRIQPGERLGVYGGFGTGPYNFYTGIVPIHEMEKKEDLFAFLRSTGRVFCLLQFRDFSVLQTMKEAPAFAFLSRRKVGGDDIVLISNR